VVWSYPGPSAIDMERRVTNFSKRKLSITVNDIEHLESDSIAGGGIFRAIGVFELIFPHRGRRDSTQAANKRGRRAHSIF
jgi:hypothetical protein